MNEYTGGGAMHSEEQSSFGIGKIVDCKIDEYGKQMYKVKWEPTWEPVENLASCQHLIDKFWSFVNNAKVNEANVLKARTNISSNPNYNVDGNIQRISEDDKSEVKRLIARTSETSVGNPTLISPNMMFAQQSQHIAQQKIPNSPVQKSKVTAIPKVEPAGGSHLSFSPQGKEKISSNSALKYVENFENPYVKIILVCKMCNKEQSLKFSSNWKKHYLSHVSSEEKPHQCPYCPKAFITATQKKKHLKTHENAMQQNDTNMVKEEMMQMY